MSAPSGVAVDMCITEGIVPRSLDAAITRDKASDVTVDRFLFRGGARSARFLVENGRTIIFQKNPRCEETLFLHHLLYPVMAAALRHHRFLVLHASCAISQCGAVLVTGESGAGKSTTVARLVAQGWSLQTDEVSALRLAPHRGIEVMPGARRIHLHEDAAAALPFNTSGLPRHNWHRKKMAIPVVTAPPLGPRKLCRIVYLMRGQGDDILVKKITGREKLALLLGAVYGPLLVEQLESQFDLMAGALEDVEMLTITRPQGAWTLEAVTEAIAGD